MHSPVRVVVGDGGGDNFGDYMVEARSHNSPRNLVVAVVVVMVVMVIVWWWYCGGGDCDDGDFGINSDDTRGGGGDDSGENGGGDGSTVDGNGYGDAYLIQANIRPGTVCLQTRYQQATK